MLISLISARHSNHIVRNIRHIHSVFHVRSTTRQVRRMTLSAGIA